MRRMVALAVLALALVSARAEAVIADLPGGKFQDLDSGLVWLDLAPYYNMSYQDAVAALPAGFHVATLPELQQLWASAPANPATFWSDFAIMGSASSRSLIWGWYDAQSTSSLGWA